MARMLRRTKGRTELVKVGSKPVQLVKKDKNKVAAAKGSGEEENYDFPADLRVQVGKVTVNEDEQIAHVGDGDAGGEERDEENDDTGQGNSNEEEDEGERGDTIANELSEEENEDHEASESGDTLTPTPSRRTSPRKLAIKNPVVPENAGGTVQRKTPSAYGRDVNVTPGKGKGKGKVKKSQVAKALSYKPKTGLGKGKGGMKKIRISPKKSPSKKKKTPASSPVKSPIWTVKMEDKLLEMWEEEEHIYNLQHPSYRDSRKKFLTLQRMAAKLDVTGKYRNYLTLFISYKKIRCHKYAINIKKYLKHLFMNLL